MKHITLIFCLLVFVVFVFSCKKSKEKEVFRELGQSNSEIVNNELDKVEVGVGVDTLINQIKTIDSKYFNEVFVNKSDLIVVIVGDGCIPCKEAKKSIARNFYDQLDKFALIDYKSIQDNYIFKAKDVNVGVPFTIIIKNGMMVGQIWGFNSGYTKTLSSYLE